MAIHSNGNIRAKIGLKCHMSRDSASKDFLSKVAFTESPRKKSSRDEVLSTNCGIVAVPVSDKICYKEMASRDTRSMKFKGMLDTVHSLFNRVSSIRGPEIVDDLKPLPVFSFVDTPLDRTRWLHSMQSVPEWKSCLRLLVLRRILQQ
eukprot:TRINITY_DN6410_c0_g1_i1.p2 TRINITY_DN6410_c0_g1~~TRINITY_DN6410_c0_g1_i1.p2  ORF type:complete len:148 (+),score=6.24 TRINITY_DN6410_c0_g1_i1:760-1203(+)